ncbi:MAG: nucleotidyltransferase domain-containing protein [archaeon]
MGSEIDLNEGKKVEKPEEVSAEAKKELGKIKEKLDTFKKKLLKQFPFISAIGLLPPQASKLVEEEEEIPEQEAKEKLIHVIALVPDEKAKEINKVKAEAIKIVQEAKPKVWVHVKSMSDLWETSFDGKYDYIEAIAMSFPLHDKGILGALRVASIHKTLVLKKFEKYVVSYVIAGSMARGEATKTSDVDVYVVIDDTDVKRMSRYELKDKLKAIIYSYLGEASEIAGVKNKLSPQVYILTEFWEAVKDAHPVIFTFIRDGVPLYDRGAFMPWKLLLRMGKIKPSTEAIDMFMSLGERVGEGVKRKLNDIVTEDIYWGVITPSQAVLMLYGIAPPTPKETVELMRKIFTEKEKLLEKKYIDILSRIVTIYKNYEHEKVKTISGKEIDELLESSAEYIKRLKELKDQVEVRARHETVVKVHDEIFGLLEKIFGKANEEKIIQKFNEEFIKKGKMPERMLGILKSIAKARKQKELAKHETENIRRDAASITSMITDYAQKKDMHSASRIKIKYKKNGKILDADGFFSGKELFVALPDSIKKISSSGISESSKKELEEALAKKEKACFNTKILSHLHKIFPEFEIQF